MLFEKFNKVILFKNSLKIFIYSCTHFLLIANLTINIIPYFVSILKNPMGVKIGFNEIF